MDSLRRFTEDVRDVQTGYECGIALEGFDDFQEGDVFEFYHREAGRRPAAKPSRPPSKAGPPLVEAGRPARSAGRRASSGKGGPASGG
jgi:hypothetical protein